MNDNSMRSPLYQAHRELAAAQRTIERMSNADSFDELEDEWKSFLNSIEKVWVKAERSCQYIRKKFQPWQGTFARERKKDPLLRYVKHARNTDQHTIQETMETKDASSSMYVEGGPGVTYIDRLVIKNGELVEYRGSKPLVFENLPKRIQLLRIKDNNKWYNPPKQHKTIKLLWPSPIDVAILALEYYREFLGKIESKFF